MHRVKLGGAMVGALIFSTLMEQRPVPHLHLVVATEVLGHPAALLTQQAISFHLALLRRRHVRIMPRIHTTDLTQPMTTFVVINIPAATNMSAVVSLTHVAIKTFAVTKMFVAISMLRTGVPSVVHLHTAHVTHLLTPTVQTLSTATNSATTIFYP